MTDEGSRHPGRKAKIVHEMREFLVISLYLAFFFGALTTYTKLLLKSYQIDLWSYGFAVINALVIAKVILIGEYARVGRRYETGPLYVSIIFKAFMFCVLVLGFHILEEIVKRIIHGSSIATASHETRFEELLARSIVVFCTFIPLFAFRELRRVMGEESLYAHLFGRHEMAEAPRAEVSQKV